jgi:hypothetical protein
VEVTSRKNYEQPSDSRTHHARLFPHDCQIVKSEGVIGASLSVSS